MKTRYRAMSCKLFELQWFQDNPSPLQCCPPLSARNSELQRYCQDTNSSRRYPAANSWNGGFNMSFRRPILRGYGSPEILNLRRFCSLVRTAESALLPEFLPNPHSGAYFDGQRESQLMRQHAHLAAMMRFVRDHEGEHGDSSEPRSGPT